MTHEKGASVEKAGTRAITAAMAGRGHEGADRDRVHALA